MLSGDSRSIVCLYRIVCDDAIRYVQTHVGRDNSVGMATRKGPGGPGIESWWGRDFPHPFRLTLVPTQPPVQREPGLSRGQSGRVVALTTPPPTPTSTEDKEGIVIPLLPLRSFRLVRYGERRNLVSARLPSASA